MIISNKAENYNFSMVSVLNRQKMCGIHTVDLCQYLTSNGGINQLKSDTKYAVRMLFFEGNAQFNRFGNLKFYTFQNMKLRNEKTSK